MMMNIMKCKSIDKQKIIRTMILTEVMLPITRVYCSGLARIWWTKTHWAVVGRGGHNHSNRSYMIQIMQTG